MFWRCFWLVACLALASGSAQAQSGFRVRGPEGIMLTMGPLGPSPSMESVTAQLIEALANFDNSGVSIRDGLVRRGEEFATRAVPYEDATRLRNEVSRSGVFGGRTVLLQAGAPLYSHALSNDAVLVMHGRSRNQPLWCGANGSSGYCLRLHRDDWEAAEIRSDSPYAPMRLGPFVPVNDAEIDADPTALAELPARTEIYRLAGIDGATATISRSVRIGDYTMGAGDIRVRRMHLGSLVAQFEPGAERGSAIVRVAPMDPSDYQTELQDLARGLLSNRSWLAD